MNAVEAVDKLDAALRVLESMEHAAADRLADTWDPNDVALADEWLRDIRRLQADVARMIRRLEDA